MTSSTRRSVTRGDLDAVAWQFLESEFTSSVYAGWPIDRRVEAFLVRYDLRAVLDDGAACAALLDRVMVNIGHALRSGVLTAPSKQLR